MKKTKIKEAVNEPLFKKSFIIQLNTEATVLCFEMTQTLNFCLTCQVGNAAVILIFMTFYK